MKYDLINYLFYALTPLSLDLTPHSIGMWKYLSDLFHDPSVVFSGRIQNSLHYCVVRDNIEGLEDSTMEHSAMDKNVTSFHNKDEIEMDKVLGEIKALKNTMKDYKKMLRCVLEVSKASPEENKWISLDIFSIDSRIDDVERNC